MKYFIIPVFIFMFACGVTKPTITQENYNKIQNGMTAAQVLGILGQPGSKIESPMGIVWGSEEKWVYLFESKAIQITLFSGKVTKKIITDL